MEKKISFQMSLASSEENTSLMGYVSLRADSFRPLFLRIVAGILYIQPKEGVGWLLPCNKSAVTYFSNRFLRKTLSNSLAQQ